MQWTLSRIFWLVISRSKQTGEKTSTIVTSSPSFLVKEQQLEVLMVVIGWF